MEKQWKAMRSNEKHWKRNGKPVKSDEKQWKAWKSKKIHMQHWTSTDGKNTIGCKTRMVTFFGCNPNFIKEMWGSGWKKWPISGKIPI